MTAKKMILLGMFAERFIDYGILCDVDQDIVDALQSAYDVEDWDRIASILDNEF